MNEDLVQRSQHLEGMLSGIVPSHTEQDDDQLVKASQQGDQEAFALLVQRHQRHVFHLNWLMLQEKDDAGESTREAFVAAWQGLPSFRGETRFSTWLYRIAYHCCLRQLERRRWEQALQTVLLGGGGDEPLAREARERQAIVCESLEQLPVTSRLIVFLRYREQMTYEEIASTLTLSIGTIKTHLFQARNILKERLLTPHHKDQQGRINSE